MSDVTAAAPEATEPAEPTVVGPEGWAAPPWLRDGYFVWLPRVAVLVGAVLRIRNWAHDRSLWLDEIEVAVQIEGRSFAQLTHPLGTNQAAPIGWLWAERTSVDWFGTNENALRLVPLLFSLAALAIAPYAARQLIGVAAAPVAVVLFATSPGLIYFAAETKQYSSDATCVLLVLVVSAPLMRSAPTWRRALLWGLATSGLAWFSFPAVVVSAACGAAIAVRWVRRPRVLLALAGGGALLAANLLAQYEVTLRKLSDNRLLVVWWQWMNGYPRDSAGLRDELSWLHRAGFGVIRDPVHLAAPVLVLLAVVWGAAVTARWRLDAAVLLCLPIAVAIGLAVARRYPMAVRLSLFLIPSILMLLAAGVVGAVTTSVVVMRRTQQVWPVAVVAVLAAALLVVTAGRTTVSGIGKIVRPDEVTSGRDTVAFVAQHRRPSDLVLVEAPWALPNFHYYGPRQHVTSDGTFSFSGSSCRRDPFARLRGRRAWLLLAHRGSDEPANRNQVFLSGFQTGGTLLESYRGAGDSGAYLLDFADAAPGSSPPPPGWRPGTCLTVAVSR